MKYIVDIFLGLLDHLDFLLNHPIIFYVLSALSIIILMIKRVRNWLVKQFKKPINWIKPQIATAREKEIRRLVQQIETGQSAAIIGVFSPEKSAILDHLRHENIYDTQSNQFVLSYLDISDTIEIECTPAQFWQYALEPLSEKIDINSTLFKVYQTCLEHNFSNRFLEKLIEQMRQDHWRLVLLLNRFETLLHRPNLNQAKFFGGLRLLASSHSPSPISLIISLNQSISQFHQDTKALNPTGSPYLNFLESGAITLGALSEKEIDAWLTDKAYQFNETERNFLKTITGHHPYLLQIAAGILIEAKENQEDNPIEIAKERFTDRAENLITNFLHACPPNICKAFIYVAQDYDVSDFNSELKELKRQGFIENQNGKWQMRSSVLADVIADKTVQELCKKKNNPKDSD